MTVETDPEAREIPAAPGAAERHLDVKVVKLGGIDQFEAGGAETVVERLFRLWIEECRREAKEAEVEAAQLRQRLAAAPAAVEAPHARPVRTPGPSLAFVRPESGGGDV